MMTMEQFRYGRDLTNKVNSFVMGDSDSDIYDLLDEIQLRFNDGKIVSADYTRLMEILEPYLYEDCAV